MTEKELLYVKTIAETKSISKAAGILYMAQPSLSQALQKIEENIGTPLFQRNREGMDLTFAGQKYYKTATEILNIYSDFLNEVTYINDLKKGKITLGITGILGKYLLPVLLPKFKENYPSIEVHIKEENSTELERLILNGAIDFAIMHSHPLIEQRTIKYDYLYEDYFVMAMTENHPISKYKVEFRDLPYSKISLNLFQDEMFISLDRNKRIRQVTEIIINTSGINPNISLDLKNFETALRLVSKGFGVMLMPLEYGKVSTVEYPTDYFIIDNNKQAYWNTSIVTNPNMYLSKAAKVFIDLVHYYYQTSQPL